MRLGNQLIVVSVITILFLLAIAVNISPYLRGPAPYFPDWRWGYEPTNTLSKLYVPLICLAGIYYLIYLTERKERKKSNLWFLSWFVILGFLLQLAILFYSRAGLNVLVNRIIYPGINGYFTTALTIHSFPEFIHNFNSQLGGFPMYAKFHPPGAVLFFYFFFAVFHFFAPFLSFLNHIFPAHNDVALIWKGLTDYQKATVLFTGVFIPFLAEVTIVPLYFCARLVYGEKVAMRNAIMFLFVPSMFLFTPQNDTFMPLLTAIFLYCFVYGLVKRKIVMIFLSGVILGISCSFTLTFLPLLGFLGLLGIIYAIQKKLSLKQVTNYSVMLLLGFLLVPLLLLFLFQFNSIEMIQRIMYYHYSIFRWRKYSVWIFYNLYDFFLFIGIPLTIFFCMMFYQNCKELLKQKSAYIKKTDFIFLAFVLMLFIVDISGSVRGETARIWTPFIPILVLFLSNFMTKTLNFSQKQFFVVILLQTVQLIVFQSVLITVS